VANIVILDDDQVMVELLRTIVEDAGHDVVTATDLDDLPPDVRGDLVISDLMPLTAYRPEPAREWVRRLRARFGAPLIIVTAHAAALREADRLGADAVVAKPFEVEMPAATIRDVMTADPHMRKTP
jgi:DNA-binding response OmpR family regulator